MQFYPRQGWSSFGRWFLKLQLGLSITENWMKLARLKNVQFYIFNSFFGLKIMQAILWLRGPRFDVESEIQSLEATRVVEEKEGEEENTVDSQTSNKFVAKVFKLIVRQTWVNTNCLFLNNFYPAYIIYTNSKTQHYKLHLILLLPFCKFNEVHKAQKDTLKGVECCWEIFRLNTVVIAAYGYDKCQLPWTSGHGIRLGIWRFRVWALATPGNLWCQVAKKYSQPYSVPLMIDFGRHTLKKQGGTRRVCPPD